MNEAQPFITTDWWGGHLYLCSGGTAPHITELVLKGDEWPASVSSSFAPMVRGAKEYAKYKVTVTNLSQTI